MESVRYPGEDALGTEDDAWAFLDWLQEQPANAMIESSYSGSPDWAKINLHYDGKNFDATITPPMMESLLVLQSAIYRSYALAKYGEDRASRLTKQDKFKTEIVVKVSPGTTGLDIDGTKIATHFIDVVGHAMNGTEVTITAVVALLLFFGVSGLKLVLNHRGSIQAKQIEGAERADARADDIRRTISLSEQETKRFEILESISSKFVNASVVRGEALRVAESQLKSIERSEHLEVQGVSIPGPVASDIMTTPRSSADQITIKSTFQIMSVDGSASEGFRARVRNISSDSDSSEIFVATLKDTFLSDKEGETVQTAFWKKRLVYLEMDAKLIRGQIKEAEIIKAKILERPAPVTTAANSLPKSG